jgi:hypothetical protein
MAERKVQNRYIPPDFDPTKLPRGKRSEQGRMEIRMMLPFSVQCIACGNFMVRGSKFNSKKEDVAGEVYLGMKIFRFIMKCSQCNALFSIKTDPKNADYAMEFGASRNFELWRDSRDALAAAAEKKETEEEVDPMRALEHRTEESRRQIEIIEELEGLRDLRASQAARGLGPAALLDSRKQARGASDMAASSAAATSYGACGGEPEVDDDAAVASAVFEAKRNGIKRLRSDDGTTNRPAAAATLAPIVVSLGPSASQPQSASFSSAFGVRAKVTVRPKDASVPTLPPAQAEAQASTNDSLVSKQETSGGASVTIATDLPTKPPQTSSLASLVAYDSE